MDQNSIKLMAACAGGKSFPVTYVEDVFAQNEYEGNGGQLTIVNGIDLAGEGGAVLVKPNGPGGMNPNISDTENGIRKGYMTNVANTLQSANSPYHMSSFNSNGFTAGEAWGFYPNWDNMNHHSLTFRKSPHFFDVVTYTGNGTAGRVIPHNLQSAPCMIWVKADATGYDWAVYHKGNEGYNSVGAEHHGLQFNTNGAEDYNGYWNDTAPTSSGFTVGSYSLVNNNGTNYTAYIFGDAEKFGANKNESIVKVGQYTGNGETWQDDFVNMGWEPQFVLIKRMTGVSGQPHSHSDGHWWITSYMRGGTTPGTHSGHLAWNLDTNEQCSNVSSDVEQTVHLSARGLSAAGNNTGNNSNTGKYVYYAIRMPQKPMTATEKPISDYFWSEYRYGNGSDYADIDTGIKFPHMTFIKGLDSTGSSQQVRIQSRNMGRGYYKRTGEQNEIPQWSNYKTHYMFDADRDDGLSSGGLTETYISLPNTYQYNNSGRTYYNAAWAKCPGFYDSVTCLTSGNSSDRIYHNLGGYPDMVWWITGRNHSNGHWRIWHKSNSNNWHNPADQASYWISKNSFNAWAATNYMTAGTDSDMNQSGSNKWSTFHLFKEVAGKVKIGSYTGNGGTLNVSCGFSNGFEFVMLKENGQWSTWECLFRDRINHSSNYDNGFSLDNSSNIWEGNFADSHSGGFTVIQTSSRNLNKSGKTYYYMAIAR